MSDFTPTPEQEELADKIRDAGGIVLRTPLTNPDGSLNEKTADDLLDALER
jgi:hypothetical protein